MKISTLIVVMGVIGALTAAMVTREQMLDVAESQKESFNSINTKLYASAWTNKSEQSWQDYLDQYNPDGFSEDYEGIFTPDSEVSVEPGFIYNSIVSGAYDDAGEDFFKLFYGVKNCTGSAIKTDIAGNRYAEQFEETPCSTSVNHLFVNHLLCVAAVKLGHF